jgi:hypothetical protein
VSDLVEFLRARLDEDAERVLAAPPGPWAEDASHSVVDATGARVIYSVNGGILHPTLTVRAHVLGHDPARVLREVEAKRRTLELHARAEANFGDGFVAECCKTCDLDDSDGYPCATLRVLAAVYADHPDYRPEWTPAA